MPDDDAVQGERVEFDEVRVLRLEPDDVFVLTYDDRLTARDERVIADRFAARFPGHRLIMLGSAELHVIRPQPGNEPLG